MSIQRFALLALAGVLAANATAKAAPYGIRGMPLLPNTARQDAYSINSDGDIVGRITLTDSSSRPVLWRDSSILDLFGNNSDSSGEAYGISDTGIVIGTVLLGNVARGFVWQDGDVTFPVPVAESPSSFTVINRIGAFGGSMTVDGDSRALVGLGSVVHEVNSRQFIHFSAMNSFGTAVGNSMDSTTTHGLVYSNDKVTELNPPSGYDNVQPSDINDTGKIATFVWRWNGPELTLRGAIYDGSDVRLLDALPGDEYTIAESINSSGDVLGYSRDRETDTLHPVLWPAGNATPMDLQTMINPSSRWSLMNVYDMNDSGQIVGAGVFEGQVRAFVLTPSSVPEPASAALAISGCVLFRTQRRAHLFPRRRLIC